MGLLVRFMMLFNIRFMGIYALQLHAERQHINFMAIEANRKELQQQKKERRKKPTTRLNGTTPNPRGLIEGLTCNGCDGLEEEEQEEFP